MTAKDEDDPIGPSHPPPPPPPPPPAIDPDTTESIDKGDAVPTPIPYPTPTLR